MSCVESAHCRIAGKNVCLEIHLNCSGMYWSAKFLEDVVDRVRKGGIEPVDREEFVLQ